MLDSVSLGRRSPKAVCFYDSDCVIVTNYWGSLLRIDLNSGDVTSECIAENGISSVARCGEHLVAVSYDGGAYLVDANDLGILNVLRCMTQRLYPSGLIQPDGSSCSNLGVAAKEICPMRPFVILAAPRTGSNMLCTLLNSHPAITCHHEIFNPRGVFPRTYASQPRPWTAIVGRSGTANPLSFLEQFWKTMSGPDARWFQVDQGDKTKKC